MPALQPVLFTARCAFRGTANGQAIVNVFHVANSGGPYSAAGIAGLATALRTAYEGQFVPRLNGSYSGDNVRLVDLTNADGVEYTLPLSGTPAPLTVTVPQSAAACITWRINRHYRGGHPRTYIGPLATSAIESPTSLAAAYVTALQNAANNFLTAVNAITTVDGNCRLVAVHRQYNGEQVLVPIKSDIVGATVDTRIDSQRRRLGRDR